MSDDYVSDLRAFCAEWLKQNRGYDLIDHGFGPDHGGELTTVKLTAALDELEKLRRGLQLVLDQHYPVPCGNVRHEGGNGQHCAVCEYDDIETGWWPCPTARGAMAALGDAAPQQPEYRGEFR